MKHLFFYRSLFSFFLFLPLFLPAEEKAPFRTGNPADHITPFFTDSLPADTLLRGIFQRHPLLVSELLASGGRDVQLIYTQIDRGANGVPALRHHYWQVDSNRYFYPGAAVRLPLALLVQQRMNEWKPLGIDRASTLLTESDRPEQTAVYNDPAAPDGRPSVGLYLKKMLLGEDMDAFNRLYELLGQQYIHRELQAKGYGHARIVQRMARYLADDDNRCTNPVRFLGPGNKELYRQPLLCNPDVYPPRHDSLGKSYHSNGKLYPVPLNCSGKNRSSLFDLHQWLISLIFPAKVPAAGRFSISDDERHFLLRCISEWPGESDYPPYGDDTVVYFPAKSKYLLLGAAPGQAPAGIRIFNVTGKGYGQLTDVAYIADFERKTEFFLSVVVDCTRDGILHPDTYEYQSAGLPLMKELGRVLYEHELARERKWLPDLTELRFVYDHP
jgi:hypothetical protein